MLRRFPYLFLFILMACNQEPDDVDIESDDFTSEETTVDSIAVDTVQHIGIEEDIDLDEVFILDFPITLERDKIHNPPPEENSSIHSLPLKREVQLGFPNDWMHPSGFDFKHKPSSTLMGMVPQEEFDLYITYHECQRTTFGGFFMADFYQLTTFNKNDKKISSEIVATYEELKDGGMGHYHTWSCEILEDLSFRIFKSEIEFDYEDDGEYESNEGSTEYWQIDPDGEIYRIPD